MEAEKHNPLDLVEEELFDQIVMTEEQEELFYKLNDREKKFSIAMINGRSKNQAYYMSGGKS